MTSVPTPPYNTEQRKAIANEILAAQSTNNSFKIPFVALAVIRLIAKDGKPHGMSDVTLQNWAKVGNVGGHPTNPNPINGLNDFLRLVSSGSLWTRVAEFGVGAILIGVGLNAVFKGKPGTIVKGAAKGVTHV